MFDLHKNSSVFFNEDAFEDLNKNIRDNEFSSVFILVDENTQSFCLDLLKQRLNVSFQTICIRAGEEFKHLQTCLEIWQSLSEKGADRNSLLISLGGGVITDIGGFVASCFKRGIIFIHIPTTLLGMVDAALGGKNGVDLNTLKNQIGVIRSPEMIIIDTAFLKTLPTEQINSGFAEMIKHGMIHPKSETYFEDCMNLEELNSNSVQHLIKESVSVKLQIVETDINEKGLRKALNYGHTLGHAIESFRMSFEKSKRLLHGEAIAIGLVLETFISYEIFGFPEGKLNTLKDYIHKVYTYHYFDKTDQDQIIDLMKHDKKNLKGKINFVLLKNIGEPVLDCNVENQLIYKAFDYYHLKD